MVEFTPQAFHRLASAMLSDKRDGFSGWGSYSDPAFEAYFGATPMQCSVAWSLMENRPANALPKHFLWALLFLKVYASEEVLSKLVGTSRETYQEWVWRMLICISAMYPKLVSTIFDKQSLLNIHC